MMAKFLIINGSNPKNIGIIRDYSETFESPDVMKLTEEQVNEWNTISPMERTFRLNEYRATNDKKKIFQIVEVATKPIEKESVENPDIEIEEPLNEPINEVKEEISESEYNEIKEEFKPVVDEMISNAAEEIVKAKRAYNKKVK